MLQQKNDFLVNERTKLEKRVSELTTDLSSERELRVRVEQSQTALTRHVHDMELALEVEKEQVS